MVRSANSATRIQHLMIFVGNYLEDQRAALFAGVLDLLLVRPPGRTVAIPMHSAEPPFRVLFPTVISAEALSKANCGYKFHANWRSAAFGTALTLSVPNRAGRRSMR